MTKHDPKDDAGHLPARSRRTLLAPLCALVPNALVLAMAGDPETSVLMAKWMVRVVMTGGAVILAIQVLARRDDDNGSALALLVWTVLLAAASWSAEDAMTIWILFLFKTCGLIAWAWSRVTFRPVRLRRPVSWRLPGGDAIWVWAEGWVRGKASPAHP